MFAHLEQTSRPRHIPLVNSSSMVKPGRNHQQISRGDCDTDPFIGCCFCIIEGVRIVNLEWRSGNIYNKHITQSTYREHRKIHLHRGCIGSLRPRGYAWVGDTVSIVQINVRGLLTLALYKTLQSSLRIPNECILTYEFRIRI